MINVFEIRIDCFGYKSTPAVVFWQWANQSFNALVNYTNRNAKSAMTTKDLLVAYTTAVGGALGVAVGMKQYFAKRQVSTLMQKMVPFVAVAVANAINIPLMRQKYEFLYLKNSEDR
ncbi:unnamed protein product [Cylicostephanus goldi]|uniref:Uncharacterized protein n=1 Tax=Cylicostephanus goldi TaxID=71465 RepID=A0A3P6RNN5_CYLGO|nr:unnamed protein product [Cylicostephanus goldi]